MIWPLKKMSSAETGEESVCLETEENSKSSLTSTSSFCSFTRRCEGLRTGKEEWALKLGEDGSVCIIMQ